MHNRHLLLLVIFGCCVFWDASKRIHAQQLPENYQNLSLYALDRACDALAGDGFTPANRADAFVAWMGANEWQSLELQDLFNLYSWVNTSAVDRR